MISGCGKENDTTPQTIETAQAVTNIIIPVDNDNIALGNPSNAKVDT